MKRCYSVNGSNTLKRAEKLNKSYNVSKMENVDTFTVLLKTEQTDNS